MSSKESGDGAGSPCGRPALPLTVFIERKNIMEKAFAYICADAEATPRLLRRYCRKVYELGYVPICPKLSEVQYRIYQRYPRPPPQQRHRLCAR